MQEKLRIHLFIQQQMLMELLQITFRVYLTSLQTPGKMVLLQILIQEQEQLLIGQLLLQVQII